MVSLFSFAQDWFLFFSGLVSLFFLQAQRTLQQQECLDSEFFSLICHLAMFFATLLGGEQEVVTFSFQLQVISEHRDFEKFTDLPGEASPTPNFTYIKVSETAKISRDKQISLLEQLLH